MRYGVGVTATGSTTSVRRDGTSTRSRRSSPSRPPAPSSRCPAGHAAEFEAMLGDVPHARIGVTGGRDLEVVGHFSVSVAELKSAHEFTLPAVFGA